MKETYQVAVSGWKNWLSKLKGKKGAVFLMVILFLAVLSVLIAGVLAAVSGRAPLPHQDAAWHQARLAAEAGIASVSDYLNSHVERLNTTTWPGWTLGDGTTAASGTHLGISGSAQSTSLSGTSLPLYFGTPLVSTNGTEAYVNISIKAVYPNISGSTGVPWFLIRSMGTAPIGGPKRNPTDKKEVELRRISLHNVRPGLRHELPSAGFRPPWWPQQPTVSRVIQVLAKPRIFGQFSFAIFTQQTMNWGRNGKFYTDSYLSSACPGGDYPGGAIDNGDPAAVHSAGNVGTNSYESQAITTNGGAVNGTAQTPTGASGVDLAGNVSGGVVTAPEISLQPPEAPSTDGWQYRTTTPAVIPVLGNTLLHVTTAGAITFTGTGRVTLVVDSDWNIRNGDVLIPPSVQATIYVGGNIDFGNGHVNDPANGANSGRPGNLIIYGTCPAGGTAYSGNGNPIVSAAIYAPTYNVTIKGGGTGIFYGSIVANRYEMNGGGNLCFHYDECLAEIGTQTPVGYSMTTYFEDYRL